MSENSREKILNRLKNIEAREEELPSSSGFHFLRKYDQDLLTTFKQKLTTVNGQFIYCQNEAEFSDMISKLIGDKNLTEICCLESNISELILPEISLRTVIQNNIEAGITGCEFLVAQTGSAILSTQQTHSRQVFAYSPIHIIVSYRNQLIGQLEEGLTLLAEKYKDNLPSQITTITGPSRTADIEKTLVLGAHGPKELIIFYIDVDLK